MKVLLSGGGTLGSVSPLLAIQEILREEYPEAEWLWVGTAAGPERELAESHGLRFASLTAGKLRRYASLLNLSDIGRVFFGFLQACALIWREDPTLCISAGGYVSVPLHFAAWWFGVPAWVHQEDIHIGLASRLMAPLAGIVTTATERNSARFPKKKTRWLGNLVRSDFFSGDKKQAERIFNLKPGVPVILALGGSTGSLRVNQIVVEAIHHLESAVEIIHLTGRDRPQELIQRAKLRFAHYHPYQFLTDEIRHAYAAADMVVARGGFGTIREAAAAGKPIVLIPKSGQQEVNARFLADRKAAIVLDERTATGAELAALVKQLLSADNQRKKLALNLARELPGARKEDILHVFAGLIKTNHEIRR